MTLLPALQSVLSAEPEGHGNLRWQSHLPVALVMAVNALIAFLAGYATMAIALNIVTLLCLGFVLAGVTRGIRRELKGAPDELFQSTISRVGPAAADASKQGPERVDFGPVSGARFDPSEAA